MGCGLSTLVLPKDKYSETDEKRTKLQKLIDNVSDEASDDEISGDLCLDIFFLEYQKTLWGWVGEPLGCACVEII